MFQIPTLAFFLAKIGLVTAKFLWRNIRYAILIIFIRCGTSYAVPGPVEYGGLRRTDARPLFDRDCRRLVCPPKEGIESGGVAVGFHRCRAGSRMET